MNPNKKASEVAALLNLNPHPEGGFYSETFRDSSVTLLKSQLPPEYKVDRPVSTSIYFLLPSGSVSRLHRIPCAETWHFYMGEPLTIKELSGSPQGDLSLRGSLIGRGGLVLPDTPQEFSKEVLELSDNGHIKMTTLGLDLEAGQRPQYTVPPNLWFGSYPTRDVEVSPDGHSLSLAPKRDAESHYSLVGCTCAPAFQFEDFQLAQRNELIASFPKLESLITHLTFPN